jgi:hypothetical protein
MLCPGWLPATLITSAIESAESGATSTRCSRNPAGMSEPMTRDEASTPNHFPRTRAATNTGTSTQPRQSLTLHTAPAMIRNIRCTGRSRCRRIRKMFARSSFGKFVTSTPAMKQTTIGDSSR